jgi:hypothetical protein
MLSVLKDYRTELTVGELAVTNRLLKLLLDGLFVLRSLSILLVGEENLDLFSVFEYLKYEVI